MIRLFVMAICTAAVCSAARAVEHPRLRVNEGQDIYWLDDSHVLYQGFADEILDRMEAGTLSYEALFQSPGVIRSLNVVTGAIRERAINHHGGFCFSGGNILYKRRDSAETPSYYVFGPLDGKHSRSERADDVEKKGASRIRCYNPDVAHLPSFPSEIVPLREEHGFVELRRKISARAQPESTEHELFLYKPDSNVGIPIAGFKVAHAQNLSWRRPVFAPWKNAYFIYTVGVRDSLPNSAWWLFPDGRTESINMPCGSWNDYSRTNAAFYPVKCGLLVNITFGFGELLQLRQNNGLLSKTEQFTDPRHLLPGRVWRLSVSPSGTKVAVAVGADKIPSTNPSFLRVLEVCKE